MKKEQRIGFGTSCVHAGFEVEQHHSHITPIYASSTYLFDSAEHGVNLFTGKEKGYIYGRFGNPTNNQTEEKIAALEAYSLCNDDGSPLELKAILHSSGMAAIATLILANVKNDEKVLTHLSLYGGTQELVDKVLPNCGIETIIIDFKDLNLVEETLKHDSNIKLLYLETPANPTLQCVDIEALTQIAHLYGCKVSVDNTFATPYLQQPFRFGVDFVMHSTTKFLNGHGTAVGGVLIGRDLEWMKTKVTKHHRLLGGNSNAFDAFLLNNGLKTLQLRMQKHCANAEHVAAFLQSHANVAFVNYLGLEQHPDFHLCKKQMRHAGALMSFEVQGGFEAAKKFINQLALCTSAVSLGTCDTLISHPASTTHVGVAPELRLKSGITDGLIRMSVGIEDVEDILGDLEKALRQ
ncbi:MAG: aminotransferase class V-fold PLP-dependent enzyme [Bacteroidetes bacterium]|nr:aminotransferase class V-fold PLP-dependent enzyme [Bacteroidota bacterium]MBP6315855.1 aminotransferase class V-fold PLP-dependent enzyme [Chitinophagaceae bacterium]